MNISEGRIREIIDQELTSFLVEGGYATQEEIDEGLFDFYKSPILRFLGLAGKRGEDYGTMKRRLKALKKAAATGAEVNISQAGKPLINQVKTAVEAFLGDMQEVGVPLDSGQRRALNKLIDDLEGGLDSILSQTQIDPDALSEILLRKSK